MPRDVCAVADLRSRAFADEVDPSSSQEVMALSTMNWNQTRLDGSLPVT
jgi:hypothetical protein